MKRLLMIAFQYPPFQGSSGVQRIFQFSRYLTDHGWLPTVLTAWPSAYLRTDPEQESAIPARVRVHRAFALDAARHLAIAGRYLSWTALPDRWGSWYLGAVPAGLRILGEERPDAIWSSFPLATAHWVASTLQRVSGLPWIADFRDSMTEANYPADPRVRRIHQAIERRIVRRCARAVFTTPGARRMYAERYRDLPDERWSIIANGYDEDCMRTAERDAGPPPPGPPWTLLHSGFLYRSERDPRPFFAALGRLRAAGKISDATLRVVLRASGDEDHHREGIAEHGLERIVALEPPVPYSQALREMFAVHGLLAFQATNCNHQIPAKIYEYLRSRRPVFALTDPAGDTAGVLRSAGTGVVARWDDVSEIADRLERFLDALAAGCAAPASETEIRSHSRRARAGELARLLDAVVASPRDARDGSWRDASDTVS